MLMVVRSPAPALPLAGPWPAEAEELLAFLQQEPERCHWIVPGPARRRAIEANATALLPYLHSLEDFVRHVALRPGAPAVLEPAERIVRLAQAWNDITGSSAGPALLGQLDCLVRDWQLCGQPPPPRPADYFESLVQRYLEDLERDGVHDEPAQLAAMVRELSIEATPLPTSLKGARLILFDGFVRVEPLHLRLITELSRRIDVLVWLPGLESERAEEIIVTLRRRRVAMRVVDDAPRTTALVEVERRLFAAGPVSPAVPGLFRLEADTPRREVEQVARCIRGDVRASGLSPRDMALIVPNDSYAALAAEILPRHGMAVDRSALKTRVSETRPAWLLASAWQLVRRQWRYEAVRNFLAQPIVRRQLVHADLLDHLFEHRPRALQERSSAIWLDAWEHLAQREDERANTNDRGEEETGREAAERERRRAERRERAAGLARLLGSIRKVLQPVIAMEEVLGSQASRPTALSQLAEACRLLFDAVAMREWLAHADTDPRDVRAYRLLDATLAFLSNPPRHRAQMASLWQPDPLDTLRGVMDALAVSAEREAQAVRIALLDEGASLSCRHVYVLGLQEGVQLAAPEPDAARPTRLRHAALRDKIRQSEAATRASFRALFAPPTDQLVLCRSRRGDDDRARPSPFLQAVEACAELPNLEVPRDVTSLREAARMLGQAFHAHPTPCGSAAELWPAAGDNAELARLTTRLQTWPAREGWPRRNVVDAALLLAARFPDELPFSASDLETYAACPFRYFSLRVLKLQERDADQARTHYGSLLHSVLQTFYDELRAAGAVADGEPLPPISDAHAARLRELFERAWRRLGDGVIPPDVRTMFTVDQGVLQLFMDVMQSLEGQHGNVCNEYSVEAVRLGEDAHGRPVLVSGRIDRIDRQRESDQAIILDYKTGRSSRPAERKVKTEDGRMLQLPLYAAALRINQGMTVVGGAYVHLHERVVDSVSAIEPAGEVTGVRVADVPFDPEAARRKAIELAGRIRDGDFSLTQHAHGQPHSECTSFCPLRHACRSPEGYKTISM
jgi:hypothetical protein